MTLLITNSSSFLVNELPPILKFTHIYIFLILLLKQNTTRKGRVYTTSYMKPLLHCHKSSKVPLHLSKFSGGSSDANLLSN